MKQTDNSPLQVLLLYLLWLASCGLSFLNFAVALNSIQYMAALAGADQWTFPAINRFSLVGLGIILLIFFFLCESYYRKAVKVSINRLLRAFGLVTGGQLLLLLVGYLIPLIPV